MEEYVKLKSRVDALAQSVDNKEREIMQLQSGLDERRRLVAQMEDQANKQSKRTVPGTGSSSAAALYQDALANYYTKDFATAEGLFRKVITNYPGHTLANNSQYWLGQSLFRQNRFQESITQLNKVLATDNSPKKDDSLFLMGKAYLQVGMGEQAKDSFNRLIAEYPGSEHSVQAQSYVGKL
jgi:tol-pal system protein YbgF